MNNNIPVTICSITVIVATVFIITNLILIDNQATNELQFQGVCNDFYEVACDKWEEENPLLNTTDSITSFDQVKMNVNKYFWEIISDNTYSNGDTYLQEARTFYKSCIHSRNSELIRSTYHHLIHMYFGDWQLIPSFSQMINVTNNGAPNIQNMSLTDFYLPTISQTGHSLLFSLAIDEETSAISVSTPNS
ncbi:hypothetical protein MN116_002568 [Schistosoma mekongi]|uniref:Peptidase M13 N-terminal domain-containing protein n=1 Tax=Schistosoma mekongi TaxID=38744 RepID=A0AAE1ZE61_SCHME|nr:hypothetical protein MN116_002568 [Schistosoma mekongi]